MPVIKFTLSHVKCLGSDGRRLPQFHWEYYYRCKCGRIVLYDPYDDDLWCVECNNYHKGAD